MGNQLSCTLTLNGQSFSGKALLETSELLFRGDTRLKIPFSSILSANAQNGELHIRTKDGLSVFELGPYAEKWRYKILHPKSLLEKLGVKPGDKTLLVGNFPPGFLSTLRKHGATISPDKSAKDSPWVFLAADSLQDLRRVNSLAKSMRGAAALWIVYPKGQKSVTESHVRSSGLKAGLTDVKVASFSPTHTALKFVIPKSRR
ncbi:MAG TPA: hypothetical protein VEI54_06415 [Candidatus Limnocylindrales bacterium]|nr:hypothetical protein [Candidatus Limnocylindrales bacterium]